jgi:twitching motility protein PilT
MLHLLTKYLENTEQLGARQLFFSVGRPVCYKCNSGGLEELDSYILTIEDLEKLIQNALKDAEDMETLQRTGEVEAFISYTGMMRCRVNAYRQRSTYAMTITIVSSDTSAPIRPLHSWGLNEQLKPLMTVPQGGLCIITDDKLDGSAFAASLVDYFNCGYACHIQTLEDNTSILHRHQKAIVNQRDLPNDFTECRNTVARLANLGADVSLVQSQHNEALFQQFIGLALSGILVIARFNRSTLEALKQTLFDGLPPHERDDICQKLFKLICLCVEPSTKAVLDSRAWLA